MTERARMVLSDVESAWKRMEKSDDPTEMRILWFAVVGLLRAVGHVLQKVDGAADRALEKAAKEAWRRWHDHPLQNAVFHEFIETERNILLKEYQQRYHDSDGALVAGGEVFELETLLFLPMAAGPFAGEDARDIARDAIDWWQVELSAVDSRAAQLREQQLAGNGSRFS